MPVPWMAFAGVINAQISPPAALLDVNEPIVITSTRQHYDAATRTFTYEGAVSAVYGPTVVHADRLRIFEERQEFDAEGNVSLIDPEGKLSATRLHGSWKKGQSGGTAYNIRAQIAGSTLTAERAEIQPTVWHLIQVNGTTCRQTPPLFNVGSSEVTFYPGRYAKVSKPKISLFGVRLLDLPSQRLNLDRRVEGIQFPTIAYRKEDGFGLSWRAGLNLAERTTASANFGAFPGAYPSVRLGVAWSGIPAERADSIVTPHSELSERFHFGYFDSIEVRSPESEHSQLVRERNSISVGTSWNEATGDRGVSSNIRYTKPLEVVLERNGKSGRFGWMGQTRVEYIGSQTEEYRLRSVSQGSIGPAPTKLAENLTTLIRMDGAAYGGKSAFGWIRGTLGVNYRPFPELTLSGAAVGAFDSGTPELIVDPLYAKSGFVLRADLNLKGSRISFLTKYDTTKKWFDREYSFYQVVGCLEAFVMYRQFPSGYRYGVKLRVDQFVDLLQRRNFERTGSKINKER